MFLSWRQRFMGWGLAFLVGIALVAVIWFDRLFEAPGAAHASSLAEHLGVSSVLAVFAHPDDETLAAGALADATARDGVTVSTITLTRGEQGYVEPYVARRKDLALIRESELRRYGYALGIDQQELWDYPDGELSGPAAAGVVDRIVQRIRQQHPDLVLTLDPEGGYNGNLDHRAAGTLTVEAVGAAFDSEYKPELGLPHQPKDLVYVVAPPRALRVLGGPDLRAVAATQPIPTVAAPADRRLRILGWRIHESQHLDRAYPLPGWLLYRFWDKEHYVVLDPGSVRPSSGRQ